MSKAFLRSSGIIFVLILMSACTQVKPWQRGDLARPQMALEGDAEETAFRLHTFSSKEYATGGYGGAGGGCGCN